MFEYPNTILNEVKKTWDSKRVSRKKVTPLPDDEILSILLETSYHASLLTEESRRIGFRIGGYQSPPQTIGSFFHLLCKISN